MSACMCLCVCPSKVYCLWLSLKDAGVLTLDQFSPRQCVPGMRLSGKGHNWCFCLVVIVVGLVLIGLMTI